MSKFKVGDVVRVKKSGFNFADAVPSKSKRLGIVFEVGVYTYQPYRVFTVGAAQMGSESSHRWEYREKDLVLISDNYMDMEASEDGE